MSLSGGCLYDSLERKKGARSSTVHQTSMVPGMSLHVILSICYKRYNLTHWQGCTSGYPPGGKQLVDGLSCTEGAAVMTWCMQATSRPFILDSKHPMFLQSVGLSGHLR